MVHSNADEKEDNMLSQIVQEIILGIIGEEKELLEKQLKILKYILLVPIRNDPKYIWKYLSNVQVLWNFVKYKYKYTSWNQKYTKVYGLAWQNDLSGTASV